MTDEIKKYEPHKIEHEEKPDRGTMIMLGKFYKKETKEDKRFKFIGYEDYTTSIHAIVLDKKSGRFISYGTKQEFAWSKERIDSAWYVILPKDEGGKE